MKLLLIDDVNVARSIPLSLKSAQMSHLSPKSPRPPSRVVRAPSTPMIPRPPKRLPATPTSQQEAKRIPTTPQHHTRTMTPKRAQSTPASILRKKSQPTTVVKSPKRATDPDVGRRVVKKRIIGELSTKRTSSTVTPSTSTKKTKSVTPRNVKDKHNNVQRSKSDGKREKRKSTQPHPETGTKSSVADLEAEIDASRASKIPTKRQPKVKFAIETPPAGDKKNNGDLKAREHLGRQKDGSAEQLSEPTRTKLSKREYSEEKGGNTVPKSKAKKKRPISGRFDLPSPDDGGDDMTSTPSSKKSGECGYVQRALSPEIVINEAMSESKLRLLQSSPLNRLIPEKDRKAAAAEVAAQKVASERKEGKGSRGLDSKDMFIPLDPSAHDTTSGDAKLEAARKKEIRKMRYKARQMRKRGELPDGDSEESSKRVGVVYLGHIPHGFYEKEMRSYFSQFGEVTRLRLSRSKKTGGSRGFAFLEFGDSDVASIAAEAMDGYLMHGQALVAKVVPEEEVHPDTFKGADKVFKKIPWSKIERRNIIERAKDPLKLATRSRRVKKKTKERMKSLARKGITYNFPELST